MLFVKRRVLLVHFFNLLAHLGYVATDCCPLLGRQLWFIGQQLLKQGQGLDKKALAFIGTGFNKFCLNIHLVQSDNSVDRFPTRI